MTRFPFHRAAPLLLVAGVLVFAGCREESQTVPVTDTMKQEALEAIAEGEMPDWSSWEMEETDDGVRFVELSPGNGPDAWYDDEVRVHYYLWLTDGTLVDSTRPDGVISPFDFTVGEGRTIRGWDEIVMEMNEGSEYLAVIPWELGYGRSGRRTIPGRADLVFYVELISIR